MIKKIIYISFILLMFSRFAVGDTYTDNDIWVDGKNYYDGDEVEIDDAGGYYTSGFLEEILQEIGDGTTLNGTYVRRDGTTLLMANWDVGNFDLTMNDLTIDGTFTDGTLSLTSGNFTSVGNISGSDIDINAGTGDYITTGTIASATINTGSGAMDLGDAAVANGDTNSVPTGDQVYDFCETTQAYYNSGDNASFGTLLTTGVYTATANIAVTNGSTSAGVISIYEDSDDGTNKVTITVPTLVGDVAYTLPTDDGDPNEFLQTNGSGTLTWASGAGESTTVADTATIDLTLTGAEITADLIEAGAEGVLDLQDLQGAVTITQMPTAAVTNGDTTHVSTADAIFDFCETTQAYLQAADITGKADLASPTFTGTVTMPADTNQPGMRHQWHISIVNPNAVVTESSVIPICTLTDAALTITKIVVSTSSASYELAGDLKWADARIGLANAAVIDQFDTSSGVLSDSDIDDDATVASGKFVYLSFDSAPNASMTDCVIDVYWDYDS